MANIEKARKLASRVLQKHGVQQPPVDVLALAHEEGIRVVFEELEDKISGMLVQTGQETVIGVNARHHENRQRFTLAHELAHAQLHPSTPTVYVDGMMVHFRGEDERGPAPIELEANAFAAALLMPEDFLRDDLHDRTVDMFDEAAVRRLAQRYKVSVQALTIRLMELGLLRGLSERQPAG
jgi:Zn-dependent peptidase ImmA (M78 family)